MRIRHDSSRSLVVGLLSLFLLSIVSPAFISVVENSEAAGGSRHLYTFAGGAPDTMALYTGSSPDRTTKIALPNGAEVIDFEVKLSGASSTGWSSVGVDVRDEWMLSLIHI